MTWSRRHCSASCSRRGRGGTGGRGASGDTTRRGARGHDARPASDAIRSGSRVPAGRRGRSREPPCRRRARGALNFAAIRVAACEARIADHDAAAPQPPRRRFLSARLPPIPGGLVRPTTDARLKKRIVRTLIHEAIADLDDRTAEIYYSALGGRRIPSTGCRAAVGGGARHPCRRGRGSAHTGADRARRRIAGVLNRNGLRTGHGNRWTRERSPRCAPITTSRCSVRARRGLSLGDLKPGRPPAVGVARLLHRLPGRGRAALRTQNWK